MSDQRIHLPPHRWHGSGPPLLLLAGLGAKGTSWRPFLHAAARCFSVLTLDHRGAGENPALDESGARELTIGQLAGDVLALLDRLDIERVPVIGRSMGGMVAQELALLAPERVDSMVLVSTSGRVDAHAAQIFASWASMAEQGVPAEIRHKNSMLWCLGADSLARGQGLTYLEARGATDRPLDYAAQARACASHDALERLRDLHDRGLGPRSLVVGGADDRLTPASHAVALADALGGAELALIPDAGHLVYLEQPEHFNREVAAFLGEPRIIPNTQSPGGDPCLASMTPC